MGFTPHPGNPSVFYASGHPAEGGNLGFLVSTDGGKHWHQRAEGVGGPVDFHQMDVSGADPRVVYGAYQGLQVSRDGGHIWSLIGRLPEGLVDLAASGQEVKRLYAATQGGLRVSRDGGWSWQAAYFIQRPATMVQAAPTGAVYAFVAGLGLLKAEEPTLNWIVLSEDWGDRLLLHLALDPTNPDRLYAVTQMNEVLTSADGGRTWTALGTRQAQG